MPRPPLSTTDAKRCLDGAPDLRLLIWQKTFYSEEEGFYENLMATDMVRPLVHRRGHGLFDGSAARTH